jgi:hypothetical protein
METYHCNEDDSADIRRSGRVRKPNTKFSADFEEDNPLDQPNKRRKVSGTLKIDPKNIIPQQQTKQEPNLIKPEPILKKEAQMKLESPKKENLSKPPAKNESLPQPTVQPQPVKKKKKHSRDKARLDEILNPKVHHDVGQLTKKKKKKKTSDNNNNNNNHSRLDKQLLEMRKERKKDKKKKHSATVQRIPQGPYNIVPSIPLIQAQRQRVQHYQPPPLEAFNSQLLLRKQIEQQQCIQEQQALFLQQQRQLLMQRQQQAEQQWRERDTPQSLEQVRFARAYADPRPKAATPPSQERVASPDAQPPSRPTKMIDLTEDEDLPPYQGFVGFPPMIAQPRPQASIQARQLPVVNNNNNNNNNRAVGTIIEAPKKHVINNNDSYPKLLEVRYLNENNEALPLTEEMIRQDKEEARQRREEKEMQERKIEEETRQRKREEEEEMIILQPQPQALPSSPAKGDRPIKLGECPICLEEMTNQNTYVTPCGHLFCQDCSANVTSHITCKCGKLLFPADFVKIYF